MSSDATDDEPDEFELPAMDDDVVSTGAAADSSGGDERLKGLPRLLRYALLVCDNARHVQQRLVAEIDELCPNLPLNVAWTTAVDTATGLALATELDHLAVIQNEPLLRSLADPRRWCGVWRHRPPLVFGRAVPSLSCDCARQNRQPACFDRRTREGRHADYGRLWDCLLGFLEPETSVRYPDPALQTTLDLSQVSYVATANSFDPLPSPIRDRFRIVALPKPAAGDLGALLPAVMADLARERGLDQNWVLPLDGAEHTAVARHRRGGSVRRLRRIVEAVLRERDMRATRN